MATIPATPPAPVISPSSPLSIENVYEVFPTLDREIIDDIVRANNGAYAPSFEALMMLADPDYVPETPISHTTTSTEQLQNDQQYARFLLQQEQAARPRGTTVASPYPDPPASNPNILWVPVQAPVGNQGQPVVYVHYPTGSPQRRNTDPKKTTSTNFSGKKSIMNFFGIRKVSKPVASDTPQAQDILPVQDTRPAQVAPPTQYPSSHSLMSNTNYVHPPASTDVTPFTPFTYPTQDPFSDRSAVPAHNRAFEHVFEDDDERLVRNRRSRGNGDERYEVEEGEDIDELYAARPVSEVESDLYHHRLRSL